MKATLINGNADEYDLGKAYDTRARGREDVKTSRSG